MQYPNDKREKIIIKLTKITFNSSQINALSPNGTNLKYDEPLNNGTYKMENFIQILLKYIQWIVIEYDGSVNIIIL